MSIRSPLLAFGLMLLLAGCSGLLLRADPEPPPADVQVTPGELASDTGCTLRYRVYRPPASRSDDLVILAHGFLRSQARMQGLATAIAKAGTPVATLDLCNMRPWDGRHVQNARDMVALARALNAGHVVYAGFSAGGLAAVLAGSLDPGARGVLTLDLVETQGLGVRAARGLEPPLLALAGEPTNCNALDNGRAVLAAAPRARVQRIAGAGHCDFEAPTDGLCELVCADPDGTRPAPPDTGDAAEPGTGARAAAADNGDTQRGLIISSAASAVRALLDGDPSAWPDVRSR